MKYLLVVFIFLSTTSVFGEEIFDQVWTTAKNNIYPRSLQKSFTQEKYLELKGKIIQDDLNTISAALNPFLKSLNISHTGFYTSNDETFYFLKTTFRGFGNSAEWKARIVDFIGIQSTEVADCQRKVREVLDGFPALKAGIKRGDCLVKLENNIAEWTRGDQYFKKNIKVKKWNLAEAFFLATKKSVKIK